MPPGYKHLAANPELEGSECPVSIFKFAGEPSWVGAPLGPPVGPTGYPVSTAAGVVQTGKWNMFNDPWGEDDNIIYYQRSTPTSTNSMDSIGISVSWYGNECINPNFYPADPSLQYPLMQTVGTGCDTLGENPSSVIADQ